ncbi:MAG: helix-turn-helix domain-containing protein [Phenylobacterium sp.]|uniref:helix-turn-helix domain-containing protein n=1 Tax=Phenylobacterium sp. TaxID=1871053 RepID=UPI0039197AD1
MTLIHAFDDVRPAPTRPAQPARPVAANDDILAGIGVRMTFAKDEEIYGQGEDADLVYRVVSGVVRTSSFTADGRRQIGDFYYPGDTFGVETGEAHLMAAEALTDCVVMIAKRKALRLAVGDERVQAMIWDATVRELERSREHLLLLVRKTACERVASFLKGLAERAEGETVELAMSRQDMADYLGLTIETVSRMVTQLQGVGVVEFKSCRHFRVRDRAALETMAAS